MIFQKEYCPYIDKYSVSSKGLDNTDCTNANSSKSCETFQYLILNLQSRKCAVILMINDTEQPQMQYISGRLALNSFSDISIMGVSTNNKKANVTLICKEGSGILFNNSQRIHLDNLMFVSCGVEYSYPNIVYKDPITEYAAVYFYRGSDIQVTGCSFLNSSGTGIIMEDVMGNTSVHTTSFLDNKSIPGRNSTSGGLIIKRQYLYGREANYTINTSYFGNFTKIDENQLLLGRGIALYLNASNSTTCIFILETNFFNNHARSGAGMLIEHSGSNHVVRVNMYDSYFASNRVLREGGGISIQIHSDRSNFFLYLNNCNFYSNTAKWGGGLATYVFNNASGTKINITAENSLWEMNNAEVNGHGVAFSSALNVSKPSNLTNYMLRVQFSNCTFKNNTNEKDYYHNLNSIGSAYINRSRVDFIDCIFVSNYGTALYLLQLSYATFSGQVNFSDNYGTYGGAIYVDGDALMALKKNVALLFRNNNALINGGAIYTEVQDKDEHDNNNCIFESLFHLLQSSDSYNVSFSRNLAGDNNQSIFVGNPSGCIDSSSKSILLNQTKVFNYNPNYKSQVTSSAVSVTLNSSNSRLVKVMLGEGFYLHTSVVDIFNNSVYTSGHFILLPGESFSLVGPHIIGVDEFTKNNAIYIKGNQVNSSVSNLFIHLVYTKKDGDYHESEAIIGIKLVPCKVGFTYNSILQVCECVDQEGIICPSSPSSTTISYACVRYGYWYGWSDNYTCNTFPCVTFPCPGQNCNYTNGKCPDKCENSPGFCLLNKRPHNLCHDGRKGILCSECETNYSFTFGALYCVSSSTCNTWYTIGILLGIVFYWMFFISILLIILNLNLSIGSGFIYEIVYYFSIITLFTENTLNDQFLQIVIRTCVALTQLSPYGFGAIDVCFIETMNLNLHHQLFRFVTPFFVISIVLTVIFLTQYCRCHPAISFSQNSPIHAICILVIISYTSMTYTSLQILSPIRYGGNIYVYGDPKVEYFGTQHTPFALVALCLEFFISLPICFLLLFAPCLSKRLNMVKLRLMPFLDEFQACYRPKHRWFAGFYFLARQLLYLVMMSTSHIKLPQNNTVLHCLNGLILIIHVSFQPYKLKWLNLIDTILLLDIFIFFSTDSISWGEKTVSYILILVPSVYLIIIIAVLLFKRFFQFYHHFCLRKESNEVPTLALTYTSVGIEDQDDSNSLANSFYRDDGEREPLLQEIDNAGNNEDHSLM